MRLKEIYSENSVNAAPVISFEVFPPVDDNEKLYTELQILQRYNPKLISVTSSARTTNIQQNEILINIKNRFNLNVMPHMTCVRSNRNDAENYLASLQKSDIHCTLALRGDIPEDNVCTDFKYANELVSFIKSKSDLSIAVAGYPEGHIESPSLYEDIQNLKRKVEAGADVIFTQLFFENEKFFKYIELIRHEGINIPVAAGIMPIISCKQICKMTTLANITMPVYLQKMTDKYKDDNRSMKKLGVEFAINQCSELIRNKVCGLHFYTLNHAGSVSEILDNIL